MNTEVNNLDLLLTHDLNMKAYYLRAILWSIIPATEFLGHIFNFQQDQSTYF